MAYTDEPFGLRILNNINPNALGIAVSQVVWLVGSFAFTWLACYLMTRLDHYEPVGAFDEHGLRQLVLMSRETTRNLGNVLALALLGAWTGKSVVGAVDAHNKRKVYASEKQSMADTVANLATTTEHPVASIKATQGKPMEALIETEARPLVEPPVELPDIVWKDGRDAKAGIL